MYMQAPKCGKSGVCYGYFDTEEAAGKAYDRAKLGLFGSDNRSLAANFPVKRYQEEVQLYAYCPGHLKSAIVVQP